MLTHSHNHSPSTVSQDRQSSARQTGPGFTSTPPSSSASSPPPILVHLPRPQSTLRLSNPTNLNSITNSTAGSGFHLRALHLHHLNRAYTQPRPIMSRATNRPTHIPMPGSPFNGRSPNGTPLPTPGAAGATSPTSPRSSFLPSFIRTRSRAATLTGAGRGRASPTVEAANPLGPTTSRSGGGMSAAMAEGTGVSRSVSSPNGVTVASHAAGAGSGREGNPPATVRGAATGTVNRNDAAIGHAASSKNPTVSKADKAKINAAQPAREAESTPTTYRIRLVPHLESTRSLAFDPVMRELLPIIIPSGMDASMVAHNIDKVPNALNGRPPALILKVGRFTERPTSGTAPAASASSGPAATNGSGTATGANGAIGSGPMSAVMTVSGGGGDICSSRVAFKSKVVSRSHAEIWCEPGGKFFIRDTSSSSGSFLNHIRLSSPNTDSRPTPINDGDVLQLGVDYQGGQEDMYRCVKMRVELGREWQRAANEFNTNALKQLKALGGVPATPETKGKHAADHATSSPGPSAMKKKASVTDCCICLFSVTVCQSLFIAPCSHVFHYKCIRPLLLQHHPGFSCPLCRTFANLEEDVETEDAWEVASRRASLLPRKASNHSLRVTAPESLPSISAAMAEAPTAVQQGHQSSDLDAEMAASDDLASLSLGDDDGDRSEPTAVDTHGLGLPISPNTARNPAATSFSQAATPMNETFLSTLAPGMHQRLDQADQIDSAGSSSHGHGSGVPEAVEEEEVTDEEYEAMIVMDGFEMNGRSGSTGGRPREDPV